MQCLVEVNMKKNNIKNYTLDDKAHNGVRYVGQYYVTDIPVKERRKGGTYALVAGILEMLLIILAISVNCVGVHKIYIVIPLELILFCSLYYVMGAYTYMRSGDRIEQRIYDRAYSNPVQIVTVAAVLNLISFIGQTVLVVRQAGEAEGYSDYVFLVIIFVLMILHVLMWKHQRVLFSKVRLEEKTEEKDKH